MNRSDTRSIHNIVFTAETLLNGKWKPHILCAMRSGPVRLGHLARILPKASKKVLIQNLRELEATGVVVRKDLSATVLHIEYELAADTRGTVCALLDHLDQWGAAFLEEHSGVMDTGADSTR